MPLKDPEKARAYARKKSHERLRQNRPSCRECGEDVPYPSRGSTLCSDECRSQRTKRRAAARRSEAQKELYAHKESLGCNRCGYDAFGGALDFHHSDNNKERQVKAANWGTPKGRAEMEKCELLCANCHREHHYGYSS